jgi:outer membrane receptor protein involved in Fe transport
LLALFPTTDLLPPPAPGQPFQFTFPSTSIAHENYGQMRVDHNFSGSDTFFARYTIDDDFLNNAPSQNFPYFRSGTTQRNQYVTLSENHIFSPTVLNTARFSFSRTKFASAGILQGLPNNGQGPPIIAGNPAGEIEISGYSQMGPAEPQSYGVQNIYTLSDDVTVTRGKHAFKFGALLNRWNEGTQAANSKNGFLVFPSFAQFLASTPSLVEFEALTANENRDYIYNTLGFYAQDDWRVAPRLTWNLGLRYEFMTTPYELSGRSSRLLNDLTDPFTIGPTLQNNSLHDFSPRVGVAWDVFGNGGTAIRAGFGIYYDVGNIGTTLKQDSIGNPPFAGLTDIFSAGTAFFQVPLASSVLNTQSNITPQFVDYHSNSPYMIQYNMSVQQQLPWDMALGVAYVGTRGAQHD